MPELAPPPAEAIAGAAPPAARRRLFLILKLAVSAGLLAWLARQVDGARLWVSLRTASWWWLAAAAGIYFAMLVVSSWRWRALLAAQGVVLRVRTLLGSFLVATFFNNFLPSNIGGDLVRVRDTAGPAQSRTLAATVVLVDRGLGLLALVLVAACGATLSGLALPMAGGPLSTSLLWGGVAAGVVVSAHAFRSPDSVAALAAPLRTLRADWVDERLARMTGALARFGACPGTLLSSAAGAIVVQVLLVAFHVAIARALHIPISPWHLAVIVPISFVVQMVPISVNGFGIREATFVGAFAVLGLPAEAAMLLSFMAAALVMAWSLAGACVHFARRA